MASASRPTHERFNDSYAEAGIQPSTGVRKIRTTDEPAANDPTVRRMKSVQKATPAQPTANDARYKKRTGSKRNKKVSKLKTLEQLKQGDFDEELDEILDQIEAEDEAAIQGEAKRRSTTIQALKAYLLFRAYKRVTKANMRIFPMSAYVWTTFQLPLGILSTIMLGAAVVFDNIASEEVAEEGDGLFTLTVKSIKNAVLDISEKIYTTVSELVGFDVSVLFPENVFFVTYISLWAWGMTILVIMYLMYKLLLLKPLDGGGGSFKMGMFLLAVVGYSIPILNLLPWHLVWAGSVWIKPK